MDCGQGCLCGQSKPPNPVKWSASGKGSTLSRTSCRPRTGTIRPWSACRAWTTMPRANRLKSCGRKRLIRRSSGRVLARYRCPGLRCPQGLLGLSAYVAVELRHIDRSHTFPVTFSRGNPHRCLPARAASESASIAPRESVHRRRRWPRQDHRSRPHRSRIAASKEGAGHRCRVSAFDALPVAGRARNALWDGIPDPGQGVHRLRAARAGLWG